MFWSTALLWSRFWTSASLAGFRSGGSKSAGRVFQTALQFLGDVRSREGLRSTEEHLDAVKNFGDIVDAEGMRRFLGAFGWARMSFPKEVLVVMSPLTA